MRNIKKSVSLENYMNTSFFIASKLAFREKKSFSSFIIKLAFIAVSLSVCIMIIGTAITQGYQRVIGAKFNDCWGHYISPIIYPIHLIY